MFTFRWALALPILALGLTTSCRTCPMVSCHTRKVHLHNGVQYRGQPFYKKQNPAIGEKIKVHRQEERRHKNDRKKTLK
ncbi:hypothetical protein [Hymenobacter weizhouensis]|uniref:hypothetical protein n=1 Tax=Hymenobacter sp. YIM 151500-1 TaxID=2987689 RepID=UPI002225CAE0|nr:hypothetical protein [Hymenobacter sp. YIM 151500-1]UYZ64085.1 hypothetical protein OIS53_04370 [Hymenobacter sp. YIM 151500-1]